MLSYWISLICVVLSFFFYRTTSSSKFNIDCLLCWNILLRSVPLKDLDRTSLNTCTISNTGIPVYCNHSATYTYRLYFFTSGFECFFTFFIFRRLCQFTGTPSKVIMLAIMDAYSSNWFESLWKIFWDRHG